MPFLSPWITPADSQLISLFSTGGGTHIATGWSIVKLWKRSHQGLGQGLLLLPVWPVDRTHIHQSWNLNVFESTNVINSNNTVYWEETSKQGIEQCLLELYTIVHFPFLLYAQGLKPQDWKWFFCSNYWKIADLQAHSAPPRGALWALKDMLLLKNRENVT